MTATYRELTALRRPDADHKDLPTAIIPVVGRRSAPEPTPAARPARYTGQHRDGTR